MKYIKLFGISVIVFSGLIFCMSLLFPSVTIVSRAVNVSASKQELSTRMKPLHKLVFADSESNTPATVATDTLLTKASFASHIQQGLAFYALGNDSTAIQVFYKIYIPWYKPWKKFGLLLNETKYGPALDSGISRIKRRENTFENR